jgi:hypothetical protein
MTLRDNYPPVNKPKVYLILKTMKTMKRLLKDYEFTQRHEYFDMVYNSLINGNRTQARELFTDMRREDRKECYLYFAGLYDCPTDEQRKNCNFFFNLIWP